VTRCIDSYSVETKSNLNGFVPPIDVSFYGDCFEFFISCRRLECVAEERSWLRTAGLASNSGGRAPCFTGLQGAATREVVPDEGAAVGKRDGSWIEFDSGRPAQTTGVDARRHGRAGLGHIFLAVKASERRVESPVICESRTDRPTDRHSLSFHVARHQPRLTTPHTLV